MLRKSGATIGLISLFFVGFARLLALSDIKTTDGSKVSAGVAKGLATLIAVPINVVGICMGLIGVLASLILLLKSPKDGKARPVVSCLLGILFSVLAVYWGFGLFAAIK